MLAFCIMLLAPAGHGLESGAPDIAEARYKIGRKLYLSGKLQEAEREFRSAFDLFPRSAKLAFNLGRVNERLDRGADALRFYRAYLKLAPKATDRVEVSKLVSTLEARLERGRPELVVTSVPAGAKVFIGAASEPAGTTPLSVRVSPGSHAIRLELPEHAPALGTVSCTQVRTAPTIDRRAMVLSRSASEPVATSTTRPSLILPGSRQTRSAAAAPRSSASNLATSF